MSQGVSTVKIWGGGGGYNMQVGVILTVFQWDTSMCRLHVVLPWEVYLGVTGAWRKGEGVLADLWQVDRTPCQVIITGKYSRPYTLLLLTAGCD